MAKGFGGNKRGGLKRNRKPEKKNKVDTSNHNPSRKKNRKTLQTKLAHTPSPSISEGNSSEEAFPSSNVSSEPTMVYKEPSMYDSLLMTLGSTNGTFANVYRRRQREEEGRSDTEEEEEEKEKDEDDGSEATGVSGDEDDSEEGPDDESDWDPSTGADLREPTQATMLQSDDAESESEDEPFDTDQEDDIDDNGQSKSSVDISLSSKSSFNTHLEHVFKQSEADDLAKQKQRFKWAVPAVDIPLSKWVGTGDCF